MIELDHPVWHTIPEQGKVASFARPPAHIADPSDMMGVVVSIEGTEYRVKGVETFPIAQETTPYRLPYGLLVEPA